MKTFTKIILNLIYMLSLITSSTIEDEVIDEEILVNSPQLIEFKKNVTKILLKGSDKPNTEIIIDLLFTHPSNYNISIYQDDIDGEEEESNTEIEEVNSIYSDQEPLLFENAQNGNKLYLDSDLNKKFIHPLRKLESLDNYTVTFEEDKLGKKRIILELGELVKTPFILSILRKEDREGEKMSINYKIGEDIIDLKTNKVDYIQAKDWLNVTFKGIQLKDDKIEGVEDISVEYTINLFDKETLESKFENIYAYKIDNELESLYSNNIKLKGNNIKNDIYLVLQAPLNNKKEQLLLIDAVINKGEEKTLLLFESKIIKVEEQSPERVWPKDEEKDDKKNNKTKTDDDEDFKDKNKSKLYIIMICFGISVVLTLLIIFIYITLFSSKEGKIEEEKDYKDVGGIVINDGDEKNDGPATKEDGGKKINEEEE